ncbi:MAG TPA: fumarylacetoacetate hydrolase family protein [Acidimicrobiales bacterium]|jgi:2,4-didehydro-3-deoxy-L-rhamnonate hydrolase|nr:fumarylacetoacetate hydrolase family protein [Acidimicrobiales bacterium]
MPTRFLNVGGRAAIELDGLAVDVERASGGRFSSDPMDALRRWNELVEWASRAEADDGSAAVDPASLGPVVPRPSKVFGVALNYRKHAEETGAQVPDQPSVFTKFPNCLTGPTADVVIPSDFVDWEVELVAVIGQGGSRIPESKALEHVAGYCVGQDYSERRVQMAGTRPQFSLAKSYDTFGPIGPALVTLDGFGDPDDVPLWCEVNGERVQDSSTADLIFSVPVLVSYLSDICTLEPGDLIFTGTPSGVGVARTPPRFLAEGDVVVSGIDAIGELRNVVRRRAD